MKSAATIYTSIFTLHLKDEGIIGLRPAERLAETLEMVLQYPFVASISLSNGDDFHYGKRSEKKPQLTDFAGKLYNHHDYTAVLEFEREPTESELAEVLGKIDAFFRQEHPHTQGSLKPYCHMKPHRN
jgi:hypothetical protein